MMNTGNGLHPSSSQSTAGGCFLDDSFVSDVDSLLRPETKDESPVSMGGKVLISDIFKQLKPGKVRQMGMSDASEPEVLDLNMEDIVIDHEPKAVEESTQKKNGVNLRTLLSGNRDAMKKAELVSALAAEPIHIPELIVEEEPMRKSGLTARDILTGRQKPEKPEVVELLSSDDEQDIVIPKARSKSKQKKEQSMRSLIVKLKYSPYEKRIEALEKKMRSTTSRSISAKDFLRSYDREKEDTVIDLEDDVEQFEESETSQYRKPGGASLVSVLSHKPFISRHPVSKLKELEPPIITGSEMHVKYDAEEVQYRTIDLPKRLPTQPQTMDLNNMGILPNMNEPALSSYKFTIKDEERILLASERVPSFATDPRFKRFSSLFAGEPHTDIWTTMFQPQSASDILWGPSQPRAINQWVENSFRILKRSTKRHNFKNGKKYEDEMDDFIINDDDEDDTEDETYTPLMILSGPHGVGKTSAVYAMMQDRAGYVYEINASQPRGRKEILTNVRELSTTQLVHKQSMSSMNNNSFQEGVILFDDVDVLFDTDKGFWSVVEEVLRISRRPVILTCTDITEIPNSIMECALFEGSLFEMRKQDTKSLCDYLYLCALLNHCDVDYDVLRQLILDNDRDLRRCLLALEMLCKVDYPGFGVTSISSKKLTKVKEPKNVLALAQDLDLYSICDQLTTSSHSLINHAHEEFDVLSSVKVFPMDSLRSDLLPFEFDLAHELLQYVPPHAPQTESNLVSMAIRQGEKEFTKSKIQRTKRLTRNTTRQMFDNISAFFTDQDSETTVFDILCPNGYFLDVSPMIREFARFEQRVEYQNSMVIGNDPEGRSAQELLQDGALHHKKFNGDYSQILYSVGKDSGSWCS